MEKLLFHLYVFTQQSMLSAHAVPGNVPGGDTKMSKTVPALRVADHNTVNVVPGEKWGIPISSSSETAK